MGIHDREAPVIACGCSSVHHPRRIVLTGGPGAGKTATLEMIKQAFCRHVRVLPEAAGIVFGGGFPRTTETVGRQAVQRAIYYVQRELENVALAENAAIVLCDRGTVDSQAYWTGPGEFWTSVATTRDDEFARYDAVIHLRTPSEAGGYNHSNVLRTESATEALAIDERIMEAWEGHPRRFVIEPHADFLEKAQHVIELIRAELPACCRQKLNSTLMRAMRPVSTEIGCSQVPPGTKALL
jgi:predicted ATPase